MNSTKQLIVLVGPTAVGKTSVAVQLAKQLKTEIISADSRQIFKQLEIGTAKPTPQELAEVKHHFISIKSIDEEYSAGQFGRDALALISELFQNYNSLILCGGSGLYIKAVTEGFDDLPKVAEGTREKIIKDYEANGLGWLQTQVEAFDPEYYSIVDRQNPQRLMRALELHDSTGQTMDKLRNKKSINHSFRIVKIGLDLSREQLYERIDSRMNEMIKVGLFDEAKYFYPQRELNALQTVGYQEIFGFLEGLYDKDEAIRLLKRNSRRYAKRQMTWFKRDEEIKWFMPDQLLDILEAIQHFKVED